jgi:hypothetical protein
LSTKEDESKVFLQGFLDQLAASDQTNRELTQVNRELVRLQSITVDQNSQILRALSTVSAQFSTVSAQLGGLSSQLSGLGSQLGDLSKRSDYLFDQMGRLGQILVNDGYELPAPPTTFQPDSIARGFGREVVNGVVNSLFPRQGGSGRPRRR